MIAAASMTQERGFHIKPKNFKNLLSCKRNIQKQPENVKTTKSPKREQIKKKFDRCLNHREIIQKKKKSF
jgi:hypothetical protein